MSEKRNRVLVLATSRKTRGGITSVVKAHEAGSQWRKYNCRWLETHVDKGFGYKMLYFIKSFTIYFFIVHSYDLIHFHTSEPPSVLRKLPFLFLAKLFNKKVIVHFHSFSIESTINSRYRRLYHYLFTNADIILVLSGYWREELKKTFNLGNKVRVLFNPCGKPDLSVSFDKRKYILYAGTINTRKGYADLISAFAQLAPKFPDWKIVFAGNGEIEQAKLLAKKLGINTQTVFTGWISGKEKAKAFHEASIFCLPSYAEGFPMAVLDAWAYGLPVVTTPVGGLPDVVVNRKNALVFQPGDVNELSNQLRDIISDYKLRDEISEQSKYLSRNIFNQTVICQKLDEIYNEIFKARYNRLQTTTVNSGY